MTAIKKLNLWMASTTAERNALGSNDGLAVGDFCFVDNQNLHVATAVAASSSTWRPIAGLPTRGPVGLGAKNYDNTLNRTVFVLAAVTLRAVLDGTPSSVTLTPVANLNWPNLPSVITWSATGFTLAGMSSSVAPNTNAWTRSIYTINY